VFAEIDELPPMLKHVELSTCRLIELLVVSGTMMRVQMTYVAAAGTLTVIVSVPLSVDGVEQAAASAR
jgi:hypothetical protein